MSFSDQELIAKHGGGEYTRPDPGGNTDPWSQRELAEHPYYRRSAAYARTLMEPQPPPRKRRRR